MYVYEHRVHYYETDQMKVVHHSNYIRWFEECRTDMMEKEGLAYAGMEKEGIICPVVSVSCRYVSMTRFGETVRILPTVKKFNGVKLVVHYEVRDKETDELRCEGESSHCFLNREGRPVTLKKASPRYYELFLRLAKGSERQ